MEGLLVAAVAFVIVFGYFVDRRSEARLQLQQARMREIEVAHARLHESVHAQPKPPSGAEEEPILDPVADTTCTSEAIGKGYVRVTLNGSEWGAVGYERARAWARMMLLAADIAEAEKKEDGEVVAPVDEPGTQEASDGKA